MGNTTREAWQVRAARYEHLQTTARRGILRPHLPRMVVFQRAAVLHYPLVRPSLP